MGGLEKRIRRFRARMYAKLPKDGSVVKMELVFLLLFALMLAQKLPGGEKQGTEASTVSRQELIPVTGDEPENMTGELLVQYVSGSDELLDREATGIQLPEKKETTVSISEPNLAENVAEEPVMTVELTPVPTRAPENVPASGNQLVSMFSPVCYPSIKDIIGKKYLKEDLLQLEYLKDSFYIVNSTTKMTKAEFDVEYFLKTDLSIQKSEEPQILIYHTHGSEGFADSRAGVTEDSIVGVGELLAEFLREKYGYHVLHDTTIFDQKNGKDNRSYAYNDALPYVEELLEQYPSIEVIIDLHRDAGEKRVVTLDGKQVAKVMLFNGLCRNTQGKLEYLPNENLSDNLAFSFQMKLIGDEMYPGLMHRIFLKDYRYNMHLAERYLLIELGTNKNTVEEAKNAMEPLADVLAQVLGGGN